MPDRDYSHRTLVDKLGVRPGDAVVFAVAGGDLEDGLRMDVTQRADREPAGPDELIDVVIASIDSETDVVDLLRAWRSRLRDTGCIWLLTPKRGRPGYMKQEDLIPAGRLAGLVDNKICSVSDRQSGMRFVIPRRHRAG